MGMVWYGSRAMRRRYDWDQNLHDGVWETRVENCVCVCGPTRTTGPALEAGRRNTVEVLVP